MSRLRIKYKRAKNRLRELERLTDISKRQWPYERYAVRKYAANMMVGKDDPQWMIDGAGEEIRHKLAEKVSQEMSISITDGPFEGSKALTASVLIVDLQTGKHR